MRIQSQWTAVVFAAALAGLFGSPSAVAQEKTLKVAVANDLKILDPITNTGYETRNHGYMIYDTLFALDEHFEVRPQMVDAYSKSEDGLTWTFTLRDGLKWHDGNPVTAEDCVASIKRWGARDGMGQKLMDFTREIAPVDEKTFKLVLKEPYGLVLQSLGKLGSNVPFMMPKNVAATDPSVAITETIGSGPFKFVAEEWVPGSKVVYVKNKEYLPRNEPASQAAGGKVVKVDRVEWYYMPDPSTAANALLAGEIDFIPEPAFDLLQQLQSSPEVKVEQIDPLGNQGMLRFNSLLPPFNNAKARQAVLWLIDQGQYLQAAIGNPQFFKECAAYFICGGPFEAPTPPGMLLESHVDKAKKLLQESGYVGQTVVIMQPTDDPILSPASLITAQFLRQAGMTVDVQAMDWSTMASRRQLKEPTDKGGWNIFHTWWNSLDVLDPIVNLGVNTGCEERAWFGWPCDEEIEKLRDQFARESDPLRQKELVEKIQNRILEVVPHIPFGQWYTPVAYRTDMSGLLRGGVQFFWNIEKKS